MAVITPELQAKIDAAMGSAPAPEPEPDIPPLEHVLEANTPAQEPSELATETTAPAADTPPAAKDFIEVTDDTGRRQIEIDWNNKDALKKELELAHGARKWQADRDNLAAKLQEVVAAKQAMEKEQDEVLETFERHGVKGLLNHLTKQDDYFDKFIQAEVDRRIAYQNATPEQRQFMDARVEAEQAKAELAWEQNKAKREAERTAKQAQEAQEAAKAARRSETQSLLSSEAKKHSFSGRLPKEDAEAIDRAVFSAAIAELKALPKETVLTPEIVAPVFKKHAELFSRIAGKVAENVVADKKQSAAQSLQADVVSRAQPPTKAAEEIQKAIKSGNIKEKAALLIKYGFGAKR